MIEAMRKDYSICELCEALDLSKSGWYARRKRLSFPGKRQLENDRLVAEMKEIHADRHMRCYGSPRMRAELVDRGLTASPNRVARLMQAYDIRARLQKRWKPKTTQVDTSARPSPNLLADVSMPNAPGEQLVADITYIRTKEDWLYLSTVMDLFSRKIVGWNLSTTLDAENTIKAIEQARIGQRIPPTAIFHSDRGCQYTSQPLRKALGRWSQSMSAKGYCYDNAFAESYFASLKAEMPWDNGIFESHAQARRAVFDYIERFYNRLRRHSSLGMLSPERFLNHYYSNQNNELN